MRATLLVVALIACAAYAQFEGISIPPSPALEGEFAFLEQGAEAETEWSPHTELADVEMRSRNTALRTAGKKGGKKTPKKVDKGDMSPFDSLDWSAMPSDKQLPGDVLRLRYAPGAVASNNEDVLPKGILPPPGCSDPNAENDIKLWNTLTTKLATTKQAAIKYAKWMKGANSAFGKVKGQIKATQKNKSLVEKAIKGMLHQRRQIVKRLKAAKLKRDLDVAKLKMKKLNAYSKQIGDWTKTGKKKKF